MADVIQKCISGNNVKHGTIIVYVLPNGNRVLDNTYVKTETSVANIETRLTNRFDDPSYYSA